MWSNQSFSKWLSKWRHFISFSPIRLHELCLHRVRSPLPLYQSRTHTHSKHNLDMSTHSCPSILVWILTALYLPRPRSPVTIPDAFTRTIASSSHKPFKLRKRSGLRIAQPLWRNPLACTQLRNAFTQNYVFGFLGGCCISVYKIESFEFWAVFNIVKQLM